MKIFFCVVSVFISANLFAHFGMIIPDRDIVTQNSVNAVSVKIMFAHPFEGKMMDMEKPKTVGVFFRGKRHLLDNIIEPVKIKFYSDKVYHRAWKFKYLIKRPGDYIFYVKPKPYFEPEEDKFIIHYTKTIINAFSLQDSWDKEIGLPAEIIPLTRPYGIYTGNTFRAVVKFYGKAASFAEVEVEYYNIDGKVRAPEEPFITQVIKTDSNGVFSYSFPCSGWWGFSALGKGRNKLKYKGVLKDVEIGGVFWLKVYDMK